MLRRRGPLGVGVDIRRTGLARGVEVPGGQVVDRLRPGFSRTR